MKNYYVRFGRKFAIPPTVQIKSEVRRMALAEQSKPAEAEKAKPPVDQAAASPQD